MANSFKWNGKQASEQLARALPSVLRDVGEVVLDESNKIAPIDEGTLINSGSVSVEEDTVAVGYDTPYAIRQHEDMTLNHKNGRQAKFLETAAKNNRKKIQTYIQEQLKRAF